MFRHVLLEDLQERHWTYRYGGFSPLVTGAIISKSSSIFFPQALVECRVPLASCRKALNYSPQIQGLLGSSDGLQGWLVASVLVSE